MSNWGNSAVTPTILTGDNTQNSGNIEIVTVTGDYPLTFFRITVSLP